MAKKVPYAVLNQTNGYDLMVEKDSGNEVKILTGSEEHSKEFWNQLKNLAEEVLLEMESTIAQSEIITP